MILGLLGRKRAKRIQPKAAKALMESGDNIVILDVRDKEEYDFGRIKGAILIPANEIEKRAESELNDKNAAIIVYCDVGKKSETVADYLVRIGYKNAYNLGALYTWSYGTEN